MPRPFLSEGRDRSDIPPVKMLQHAKKQGTKKALKEYFKAFIIEKDYKLVSMLSKS